MEPFASRKPKKPSNRATEGLDVKASAGYTSLTGAAGPGFG